MSSRRGQILETAAELFAKRGFHGVSMADLGAACGISGPALYKHFDGKEAILATMLVDISQRLLEEGRRRDSLNALVDWHVDFALTYPALIVVQDRDWSALPDQAREQVRSLQLAYIEEWVKALQQQRPQMSAEEAQARLHATFGLINSTPRSARIDPTAMRGLLTQMALAALLA
ncbi:MAG TPA: TetR/AcrR family transcriptional regulator [Marmoricola sp.]|nr:TetR/AcrR family transcriptional regulator [Marmoricola sp.]